VNDKTCSSAIRTALLPNVFRDTAMTVASLADGVTSITFAPSSEKCLVQVKALQRDLSLAGHQPDVVNDAACAQCALLDETALLRLQGEARDKWEREPLQIRGSPQRSLFIKTGSPLSPVHVPSCCAQSQR